MNVIVLEYEEYDSAVGESWKRKRRRKKRIEEVAVLYRLSGDNTRQNQTVNISVI